MLLLFTAFISFVCLFILCSCVYFHCSFYLLTNLLTIYFSISLSASIFVYLLLFVCLFVQWLVCLSAYLLACCFSHGSSTNFRKRYRSIIKYFFPNKNYLLRASFGLSFKIRANIEAKCSYLQKDNHEKRTLKTHKRQP